MGREVYTKNILSNVRRIWTDELGKKEKDLKDIKIYICFKNKSQILLIVKRAAQNPEN